MALVINSNINSLKGMSSLRKSAGRLSKTLEHISSGIRVNKAADDAGRLGSITLAESQVRGLQKSIQNLNDGMSLAQTLEGSLGQLELILQRIRELAVQSSNDTYQAADRQGIHAETKELLEQVNKVVEQTNFNNIKLLDGSADSIGIFVDDGVRTNSFDLKLHDVRETSVGRKAQYDSQRRGVHVSDLQTGDMTINGFQVRATDDTDDNVSVSFGSGSAIAKARAINAISEQTGVTARAGETIVIANRQISAFTLDQTQNFAINGVQVAGFEISTFDADGALRQAINAHHEETGVVASLTSQGELQLVAKDGRNIQIAYSHKNVLEAVGLADTTLDPNNLAGDVILGAPDRDLKGTIQNPTTTGGFVGGLTEVGGRFDGNEGSKDNYVDFVGHVVTAGGVGTAQIVWERDPAGDPDANEDFAFIEGHVINAPNTAGVNGSYFSSGGAIVAGGSYNEGLNRDYILTVTQAGSTDGPDLTKRAVVQVSTAQDGTIINSLTLDAGAGPQLIAGATTGEHVFVDIDPSVRAERALEQGSAQEYDGTLGNGVTIAGVYTGDVSKDFTVSVIEEGYTQGANQAKVEVTEHNLVSGVTTTLGSFVVNAGAQITIGDGLDITFDAESPAFNNFTDNKVGSYAGAVGVSSAPTDFVGERGNGQYGLKIVGNGPTGLAQYVTTFNGTDITVAQTLEAGDNVLADGLTFNFDASVSTIGATNVSAIGSDYLNLNAVQIGGVYDGQLKDIDVVVAVVQEGRVIAAGEPVTSDAALLRYSIDGGSSFVGSTITAVADQDLALTNGLTIRFNGASQISELQTLGGVSEGNNIQFASGSVSNYQGTVDIDLDPDFLQISTDASIAIEVPADATVGTGVAGSGNILIHITDGGNTTTTTLTNVQSGANNAVIPGVGVVFTNDPTTIGKTTNTVGAIDGQAAGSPVDMNADNTYNGALGNTTLAVQFTGNTTVGAPQVNALGGNDGVTATAAGPYNGNFDDTTYVLTFDGTSTNLTPNAGNNDAGQLAIAGNYSGANGDLNLNVTYAADTTETVTRNAAGGGSFDVNVSGDFSRLTQNEQLFVTFDASTSVQQDASAAGSAAAVTFTNSAYNWDAGTHTIQVEFVADNAVKVHLDGGVFSSGTISGGTLANIDLGNELGFGAFGGFDPNLNLNVTVDANPLVDETGDTFDLSMNQLQTASILRQGGGAVTGITLTGATTSFNLSDAAFAGLGLDMGISLDIDQASVANSDTFTVDLVAVEEAVLTDTNTGTAVTFSIANNISLNNAAFASIFTGGNPDLALNFSDPFQSIDDSFDIQLQMAKTGTLTQDGVLVANNVDITTGSVSLVGSGVTLNLTNEQLAVDDQIGVNLTIDQTVTLTQDGVAVGGSHDVSTGTLNLAAALGTNVGFDIDVTNAIKGRDDAFEFELTRDHSIGALANTALAQIEQETMLTSQIFGADVDAGSLELGSTYTLDVEAPTLEVGKEYVVQERVGTLENGDQIVVRAINDFANGPTVLNTTTQLSNGVTLEIDPGANFNIGDEVRFQALQYQGDPNCSGPYDDPAFPTTFTVEVIQSGAVDGGAMVQYTRQDNGDTGTVAALSGDTLLQNNVHVSFTAGTLYQGDRFFIETVSDLVQDFGGELILESSSGIEIELASVTIDNELGRLLYIGDPNLAQLAGTFDSLTSAFLGVNAEQTIGEINLSTKKGAEDALRILDLAIDKVSAHRSDTGAMQNRIETQINSLSGALFQTESYVSRIRDADIAAESAALARDQLIQQAGVQILAQMNLNPQIALQLVQGL
jgi:flagellin